MKTQTFFIASRGKGEFKEYNLINSENFDMIDMFFSDENEAKKYANKKNIKIVNK